MGTGVEGATCWPAIWVGAAEGCGGSPLGVELMTSVYGGRRSRRRPGVRGGKHNQEDEERHVREDEKKREADRRIAGDEPDQREVRARLARALDLVTRDVTGDHRDDPAEAPGADHGRCPKRDAHDGPGVVARGRLGGLERGVGWRAGRGLHAGSLGSAPMRRYATMRPSSR